MSQAPGPDAGPPGPAGPPVCPRHPDRTAYVTCQRCGRPTCPECQRVAPVGIQCVDCVARAARETPQVRQRYGGAVAARPGAARPLVTMSLIAVCALAFIGQQVSSGVTRSLAYAPVLTESEPWRMLTAAFLHSPSNYLHILFNMYALWITGNYLEPMMGRARFLALYLVSAVGGSVGFLMLVPVFSQGGGSDWGTPVLGASGAVFGLFAALLVLNRHLGRQTGPILGMLAINAVLGFTLPNIAWQAHLGGALTGAAVAGLLALTSPQDRVKREARRTWFWTGLVLIVLVLAAVTWTRIQSAGLPDLVG